MGIKGLTKLLSEAAEGCIVDNELANYTGRKVAIDASMALYQFLIAIRSGSEGYAAQVLTNEAGEVTSHIQGFFNRTIRMLSNGIKPVFVFDGKPPTLKSGELAKRRARRAEAEAKLAAAETTEEKEKYEKRLTRVTAQHGEDVKELLRLMGVPIVQAPCEAEAQCAELAKHGKVWATGTEDMDALCFQTPKLLRKLTFGGSSSKQPVMEVDYERAIRGLGLTYEQFVDLCILCGCDYTDTVKGVGPKTALKLIRQHGTLERVVASLDLKKNPVPPSWLPPHQRPQDAAEAKAEEPEADEVANERGAKAAEEAAAPAAGAAAEAEAKDGAEAKAEAEADENADPQEQKEFEPVYKQARRFFITPEVTPAAEVELRWTPPDEEGLRAYLVDRMGFNAERVDSGIRRLRESRKMSSQQRMDSFFKTSGHVVSQTGSSKRKAAAAKLKAKKKGAGKKKLRR